MTGAIDRLLADGALARAAGRDLAPAARRAPGSARAAELIERVASA